MMAEAVWGSWLTRWIFGKPDKPLVGRGASRTIQLMLFIPSVDRDGHAINQKLWTRGALEWLGQAFGGATAFPAGLGVWRDDRRGGKLVMDETVIVFSFVGKEALGANLSNLEAFMTNMGRLTGQGSVAFVIGDEFREIETD